MDIALIIIGAAILFLGRKLFWLFVAVLGFTAGLTLAQFALEQQPHWMIWTAGVAAGIVGALLAIFVQKLAIGLGGFIAGAYIAMRLAYIFGYNLFPPIILLAGFVGAVLLYFSFDWALIFLSSAAGAVLILHGVSTSTRMDLIPFIILTILGILIQIMIMRRRPKDQKHP